MTSPIRMCCSRSFKSSSACTFGTDMQSRARRRQQTALTICRSSNGSCPAGSTTSRFAPIVATAARTASRVARRPPLARRAGDSPGRQPPRPFAASATAPACRPWRLASASSSTTVASPVARQSLDRCTLSLAQSLAAMPAGSKLRLAPRPTVSRRRGSVGFCCQSRRTPARSSSAAAGRARQA